MSNSSLMPREKLLRLGPQSLSDAELLAIFLRTGIKGKSALILATELLHQFSNLRQLINATPNTFCQYKGLGITKYVQIQAAIELSKRYYSLSLTQSEKLANPKETIRFLQHQLRDKKQETFAALFLNSQHQIIAFEELFKGTIDMTTIHTRPLIERALYHNAAAVILAHNHPSGCPTPSQLDLEVTQLIDSALKLIDTKLLDHIIIADNNSHSMAMHLEIPT